jgi:hypothetical protein
VTATEWNQPCVLCKNPFTGEVVVAAPFESFQDAHAWADWMTGRFKHCRFEVWDQLFLHYAREEVLRLANRDSTSAVGLRI